MNFTAMFLKVGYLALKSLLDKNNASYTNFTITQASDLKSHLEKEIFKKNDVTMVSLYIEAMYFSIKYGIVKKAIDHFTASFSKEDEAIVNITNYDEVMSNE